jgi:hypothetical protein
MTDEIGLIEARRLRDAARAIVRTDFATLSHQLAERPLTVRLRERVAEGVTGAVERTIALADENRVVVGLTVATALGWLFRNRLVRAGRAAAAGAQRAFARLHH